MKSSNRHRVRLLACATAIALAFLCPGCSSSTDSNPSVPETVSTSAQKGPITLTVTAAPAALSVGEPLTLTIDVRSEPGIAVTMPLISESLGPFDINSATTPPDVPEGSTRRWTHRYILRTFESGTIEIPPMTVRFVDNRHNRTASPDDIDEDDNSLTSDVLTVEVRSLLTGDFDPTSFRDIKDEVSITLPFDRRVWLYGGLAVLGALLVVIAAMKFIRARRSRPTPPVPPPLPHVWAMQRLDELAARRLIERGDPQSLQEFFFDLSGIIRQYIERRFLIMAAEQTTDEFLRVAQRHRSLDDAQRHLLRDFLRQADMVKFAKFQPSRIESESTFASARHFVQETALETDVSGDPAVGDSTTEAADATSQRESQVVA